LSLVEGVVCAARNGRRRRRSKVKCSNSTSRSYMLPAPNLERQRSAIVAVSCLIRTAFSSRSPVAPFCDGTGRVRRQIGQVTQPCPFRSWHRPSVNPRRRRARFGRADTALGGCPRRSPRPCVVRFLAPGTDRGDCGSKGHLSCWSSRRFHGAQRPSPRSSGKQPLGAVSRFR